jgi:predicted unusual protein kinase regulating ubiquinone biosynthesis (AarF/ABC1/UbiB family)
VAKDPIPTSRLRRSAAVGRLAAGQAMRQAGTRAVNLTRSEDAAQRMLARRQLETAEQIVAALGTMKGAAMKLGQVMSFLDVGLVPEEFREEFQAELAKLRDAAPKVSFKDMKKVLEEEYGDKLDDVFESFDPVPSS